eukprot:5474986-Amphidinium_carterae.1
MIHVEVQGMMFLENRHSVKKVSSEPISGCLSIFGISIIDSIIIVVSVISSSATAASAREHLVDEEKA